jgi:hypothetical protein
MKVRGMYHPDKGGSAENFIRIQNAIKRLKEVIMGINSDKTYIELRTGYKEYQKDNEVKDVDKRLEAQGFSLAKFNKAYDEHRYRDDLEEDGYGEYMVEPSKDRDDIEIERTIGKFKLNTFNEKFREEKSKKRNEIVKYQVPESIDMSEQIGCSLLGAKAERYTSSVSARVHYTDYMDAYNKDNTLIDDTKIEKVNKPYKKALKEYKNASLKLRPEQEKAIEEFDKKKERAEQDRMERLKRQNIEYDKYEKSMANFMLK